MLIQSQNLPTSGREIRRRYEAFKQEAKELDGSSLDADGKKDGKTFVKVDTADSSILLRASEDECFESILTAKREFGSGRLSKESFTVFKDKPEELEYQRTEYQPVDAPDSGKELVTRLGMTVNSNGTITQTSFDGGLMENGRWA